MKTTKTRIIFFTIALTYSLILGFYMRDFLVLSPTLQVFYLLSVLPTLFLAVEIKSKAMRSVIFILLALIFLMNLAYAVYCRRVFPFLAIVSIAIVLTYFTAFSDSVRKDNLLTKIYILVVSTVIIVLLLSAYIFVYKQEDVSLANGRATLWDTKTVEFADEICADCDIDEEKVKAIYEWMIHNFEYDYDCEPFIQYFNVRKTLSTRKGICYDFSHLFAALCRSQNILCYVVDGTPYNPSMDCHTWNRVYFNDTWWDIDITYDIVCKINFEKPHSFQRLVNPCSPDVNYMITKIY